MQTVGVTACGIVLLIIILAAASACGRVIKFLNIDIGIEAIRRTDSSTVAWSSFRHKRGATCCAVHATETLHPRYLACTSSTSPLTFLPPSHQSLFPPFFQAEQLVLLSYSGVLLNGRHRLCVSYAVGCRKSVVLFWVVVFRRESTHYVRRVVVVITPPPLYSFP